MSTSNINTSKHNQTRAREPETSDTDVRRDNAVTRIRTAILKEQANEPGLGNENAGNDPYNSGVHRALAKAHVWDKRSR